MKTSDFHFELPSELIAQTPIYPRDHSRLLCLARDGGEITHRRFYDLPDMLDAGDVLVVNDSRVLPARLYGTKEGGSSRIEFLLLEQKQKDIWEVLTKPGKKTKVGANILFPGGLCAEILDELPGGSRLVQFKYEGDFYAILDNIGQMPLPPYITRKLEDKERYQTVYSKETGSAAAPTAGLHFTPELLDKIRAKGVHVASVTLHVGLGTFRPVKVEDVTRHKMHSERYFLPQETADTIKTAKSAGKRVIAVGTTACRVLETLGIENLREGGGSTNIFIYPGYSFKLIDGLVTNFHLPESTLIMLVSAFAGYENTMDAYKEAVREKYRFFSFGDAMFIG